MAIDTGIDLLIGSNRHEASAWLIHDDRLPTALRRWTMAEAVTDREFHRPIERYLHAISPRAGRTYGYRFDWEPPRHSSPFGSTHCIELPFLLGDEKAWAGAPMLGSTSRSALARIRTTMRQFWANFITTGVLHWPQFDGSTTTARLPFDDDHT
jgi:para-nitrobenzyl esterase